MRELGGDHERGGDDVAGQREGSGVPVRTEEMTSVMARTEAAAGRTSSSRPSWVESTVRWTELDGQRGELVLGADPAVGPGAGRGGGQHGERSVAERGERLGLGEDLGDDRDLVALVPVVLRGWR